MRGGAPHADGESYQLECPRCGLVLREGQGQEEGNDQWQTTPAPYKDNR